MDFTKQLKYFITSPIFTEKTYVPDIADHLKNQRLQIHLKPDYILEQVPFLKIPGLPSTKQFDITWPYILLYDLNDEKLRVICHQLIIVSYTDEPRLKEKLFNLFYTAYLTFQLELADYFSSEGLEIAPAEFSEVQDYFDWEDIAESLRSSAQ